MAEIDVSTPEKAKAALGALVTRDAAREEELVKLRAEQKAMNEQLRALAEREAAPPRDPDHTVARYIGKDGRVRLHGFTLSPDGEIIERGAEDRYAPGLLDAQEKALGDWQTELQETQETLSVLRSRLGDHRATQTRTAGRMLALLKAGPSQISKLFGNVAGLGQEWMPNITLPMVERELRQAEGISQLFSEVMVSSRTFTVPYLNSGGVRPYIYGAASTEDPAKRRSSSISTAKRDHTPRGLAIRLQWDLEAAEDSIVDAMPELRRAMIEALANGESDAIVNGDTAATHQDDIANWDLDGLWDPDGLGGLGGSDDHRRIWLGLRARALDIGSAATLDMSAIMTADGFMSLKRKMHSAHSRVGGGMVFLVGPNANDQMVKFDDFRTLDKVGPRATILSGQIGTLWGHPVVETPMLSDKLNASGVYDNVTTTKTAVLAVDVSRFKRYTRRGSAVYLQRDDTRGTADMVLTKRVIFATDDASTKRNVAYGYNITSA